MRNKLHPLFCLLGLALLSGCSVWTYDLGTPLHKTAVPNPEERPAMSEVLVKFGPPVRISASSRGYIMAWEHWYITEESFGLRLGLAGADFLSLDWGTSNARGEYMLLNFDRDKRLHSASFEQFDNDTGGGKGIQPMMGFVDVVDVDDLTQPLPQHRWGATSLQSLPVTLNNDNRPSTGQNGIEQRGTPRSIGQRTLEEY
jgi:hypothetical protein